jgi:hypothetical protein
VNAQIPGRLGAEARKLCEQLRALDKKGKRAKP